MVIFNISGFKRIYVRVECVNFLWFQRVEKSLKIRVKNGSAIILTAVVKQLNWLVPSYEHMDS